MNVWIWSENETEMKMMTASEIEYISVVFRLATRCATMFLSTTARTALESSARNTTTKSRSSSGCAFSARSARPTIMPMSTPKKMYSRSERLNDSNASGRR
eukprot:Amastigsp_a512055_22.p5 type:complete len:101 gc:universal Amastigsp_a512055_22:2083-1781(-)